MNLNTYPIGFETQLMAPAQKSVLGEDIVWATHNDVGIITDSGGTYTSGTIKVSLTVTDSLGTVASPVEISAAYNTDKNTTLTDFATAILAGISSVSTCAYNSGAHTITITMKSGYKVSLSTVTGVTGTATFANTYTGGLWKVQYKSVDEVCKGILSLIGSVSIVVHPYRGYTSAGLKEYRIMPLAASVKNDYYLFDEVLKTGSGSTIFNAGNAQFLL